MGRHAASDSSTVSPPRSISGALRDTTYELPAASRSTGSRKSLIESQVSAADVIARFRDSYAPTNRSARASTSTAPKINDRTPVELVAVPVPLNRVAPIGTAVPARAKSTAPIAAPNPAFAELAVQKLPITKPLVARQLVELPLAELPVVASSVELPTAELALEAPPAESPAPLTPAVVATGPLRVSDLLARYQPTNPAVAGLSPSRSGGHHRPDPARSVSLPRLLPALRPLPSIRISVRPVLTIAAIIAAVALVEAPNLMSSSHAVANSGARSKTSGTGTSTTDTAAGDATRYGRGGTGITTPDNPADERISRSVRHAITVPPPTEQPRPRRPVTSPR